MTTEKPQDKKASDELKQKMKLARTRAEVGLKEMTKKAEKIQSEAKQ